jgi:histidine phosphotransferase ChpT
MTAESTMQDDRELAATQLLMSHLCHELVSPVGAINNGIEMLEDFGGNELEPEAVALIAESGKAAAAKLRFYRLAYGRAGQAGDLGLRQCAAAAGELLGADRRVALAWQAGDELRLVAGGAQLLLNLVVLAAGGLPRGGRLAVTVEAQGGAKGAAAGGPATARLTAAGVGAKLGEGILAMVEGRDPPLDHVNIHAWYCSRLAGNLGAALKVVLAADEVRLELEIARLVD